MIWRIFCIFMISCLVSATAFSQRSEAYPTDGIICVQQVGPTNYRIRPIIISDSVVGVQRGQSFLLEGTTLVFTGKHVVRTMQLKKLIDVTRLSSSDDDNELRHFGSIEVSVLLSGLIQTILLGREHASRFMKILWESTDDMELKKDLKRFRTQISKRTWRPVRDRKSVV